MDIIWIVFCFPKAAAKGSFEKSIVIKDCHQRLPKFCWSDGCHQRLPKVVLKWWLSLKTVIKDCLKLLLKWWLSLKSVIKDCCKVAAEVMAVFKDCLETLPKVLLKWWLSLLTVFKHCRKFCWSDACLQRLANRLEKRLQIKTAHENHSAVFSAIRFLSWAQGSCRLVDLTDTLIISMRDGRSKQCFSASLFNGICHHLQSALAAVSDVQHSGRMTNSWPELQRAFHHFVRVGRSKLCGKNPNLFCRPATISWLRACRTLKTMVKCKFLSWPSYPFVRSFVSDARNFGKMGIFDRTGPDYGGLCSREEYWSSTL